MLSLEVLLKNCRGLKEVGTLGRQNPYCVLTCQDVKFRSNTHTDGGKDPVFNQTFTFDPVSHRLALKLEVFDENMLFRDKAIGCGNVLLCKVFEFGPQPVEMRVPLLTASGKECGECSLTLTLKGLVDRPIPPPPTPGKECGEHSLTPTLKDLVDRPIPPPPTAPPAEPSAVPPSPFRAAKDPIPVRPACPGACLQSMWIFPVFANTSCWAEYDRGRLLGRGSFGRTYVAKHRISRQEFAVKVVHKRRLGTQAQVQRVKDEVAVMQRLAGQPNVVRLEKVFEDRDDVCLVMELARGGALLDAIATKGRHSEEDAAALVRDIVKVVAKCHAESVIHRDIKPENFLLTDNSPQAKLKAAGFGLSTFFKAGERLTDNVGSLFFKAPEVLRCSYGQEADIWSCGVILYLLLSGSVPFGSTGEKESEVIDAIQNEPLDLQSEPWDRVSEPAKDCIRRMLKRDPRHRAKAADILGHEWLQENGCASDAAVEVGVVARINDFNRGSKLKKAAADVIASKHPGFELYGLRGVAAAMTLTEDVQVADVQLGAELPEEEEEPKQMVQGCFVAEDVVHEDQDHDGSVTIKYLDRSKLISCNEFHGTAQVHMDLHAV